MRPSRGAEPAIILVRRARLKERESLRRVSTREDDRAQVCRESVSVVRDHVFVPATVPGRVPLVLLHGSDGHETDLLPLAGRLMPSAAKVGLRGAVSTSGGYAFFRRLPDRRIDEKDLRAQLTPVKGLISNALNEHALSRRPIAVGYSNGAIMASAVLQTYPELFSAAVLFRPLSPFACAPGKPLKGLPVLIVDGAHDERRESDDGRALAQTLLDAGADVSHHVLPTGHTIGGLDELIATSWLQRTCTR